MRFLTTTDVAAFDALVRPFLLRDPIARTVPLSVLEGVRLGAYTDPLMTWVADDADVRAVALRTPPHFALVVVDSERVLDALVDGLVDLSPGLPGVTAAEPWAHRFAERWSARTGRTSVEHMAERLFRCDEVVPPQPVSGTPRPADESDVDRLVGWMLDFSREARVPTSADAEARVRRIIDDRRMWLWSDGPEVCLVGRNVLVGGVARVGPVYTPPPHRGYGYASNLTAVVTRSILDAGATAVLFTDLVNPTSNKIYQAVGYRPAGDAAMIGFMDGAP